LTALDITVDDVGSGAKGGGKSSVNVDIIWLEEAGHDIMHAWLGIMRGHVEPDACSQGYVTILLNQLRVLKEVELAVVGAWGEDI